MKQELLDTLIIEAMYHSCAAEGSITIDAGAVRISYGDKESFLYFWEAWEIVEILNLMIGMATLIAVPASTLSKSNVNKDLLVEIVNQLLIATRMSASKAQIYAEIFAQEPWISVKYNKGPTVILTIGEARMHSLALSTAAAAMSNAIAVARALTEKDATEGYIQDVFEKMGRAHNIMQLEIMNKGKKLYTDKNND